MPDEKDISYWMGKVDAELKAIRELQEQLTLQFGKNWDELLIWRREVNDKLSSGSAKFQEHERRIANMESKCTEQGDVEKFISWPWILDNILVPVIKWGVILLLTYLLVNAIPI